MNVDYLAFPFPGQPWYCRFICIGCFLVDSHDSFTYWVELLVPAALVGHTFWSPSTNYWVELLVLEPWLDKRSGAIGRLSY